MTDANRAMQVRKLAEQIGGSNQDPQPAIMVQGVVESVDGTSLTVYLRGGSVPGVRWFPGYSSPSVSDVIWLIKNGPTYMALGPLS